MSAQERHNAAVAQAIEIAGRHPLPLTARSFTPAENRRAARKEVGCLFDGGALFLVIAPFSLLLSGDWDFAWRIIPWSLGAAPIVWAIGKLLKWRAGRGYVDPLLVIEAGEDGLTLSRGGGPAERLDYRDLSLQVRPGAFEKQEFLGIVIAHPAGLIALDNGAFHSGRTTGATILAKARAAGGLLRPFDD